MTLYVKLILQYDSILYKKLYMLLLSPTPLTLVCGGGRSDHPAFGPPASLSNNCACGD